MRAGVSRQLPDGFVRLRRALDFWEYGRWDAEGIDWFDIGKRPHGLRSAAISGAVPVFAMMESGHMYPVPAWLWSGTYLWGEAYSTGLVNVSIDRGRVAGYLCVKRLDVERLKVDQGASVTGSASVDLVTVMAIAAEAPAIGLVALALAQNVERSTEPEVYGWLSTVGPKLLDVRWPGRDEVGFPSVVRQINAVIRHIEVHPARWIGPPPVDPFVAELIAIAPVLGAAMEVYRLCRAGTVGNAPSGMVKPSEAETELRKFVVPIVGSRDATRFFQRVSKIAIPADRVSGGGRERP